MHTVSLTRPEKGDIGTHLEVVIAELEHLQKKGPRIYRTYCEYDGVHYVLTTTSKDLHLALGTFRPIPQMHFCMLLEQEFRRNEGVCNELTLVMSEEKGAMYVTKNQTDPKQISFHLSPAH